jgi:protein gp37
VPTLSDFRVEVGSLERRGEVMSDKSAIQWTDASWNPIRARNKATGKVGWFCEHMSHGCDNCYAEKQNQNTFFGNGLPYKASSLPQLELFLDEKMLTQPLRWRTPKRIFVCSMTDLFARFVPDEWIDRIFAVMMLCPQHTFQVLTKRPDRMKTYLSASIEKGRKVAIGNSVVWTHGASWPLPNVHLGTSIEDQPTADKRIALLLHTPAAVRFLSIEPLISDVDLIEAFPALGCSQEDETLADIHWVIVGGESGKNARPCNVENIRQIVAQCKDAGVPVFVKQLGKLPYQPPEHEYGTGYNLALEDKKGGDINEFPTDLRVREFPIA